MQVSYPSNNFQDPVQEPLKQDLVFGFRHTFKDPVVATCQTEVSADGFDIIRLSKPRLSVFVMPQPGGKIYEIVDLETGQSKTWSLTVTLKHDEHA